MNSDLKAEESTQSQGLQYLVLKIKGQSTINRQGKLNQNPTRFVWDFHLVVKFETLTDRY